MGKITSDLEGYLQKHAYGHALEAVIKYFRCRHFSLSYGHFLSKKLLKNIFRRKMHCKEHISLS